MSCFSRSLNCSSSISRSVLGHILHLDFWFRNFYGKNSNFCKHCFLKYKMYIFSVNVVLITCWNIHMAWLFWVGMYQRSLSIPASALWNTKCHLCGACESCVNFTLYFTHTLDFYQTKFEGKSFILRFINLFFFK